MDIVAITYPSAHRALNVPKKGIAMLMYEFIKIAVMLQ